LATSTRIGLLSSVYMKLSFRHVLAFGRPRTLDDNRRPEYNYFAPGRDAKSCDEYNTVCLSVRTAHNSKTTWPNFTIFVHVADGRLSVLFWRHCNMLRTSGFVHDVMHSYDGFMVCYVFLSAAIGHDKRNSRYSKQTLLSEKTGSTCVELRTEGKVCYLWLTSLTLQSTGKSRVASVGVCMAVGQSREVQDQRSSHIQAVCQ